MGKLTARQCAAFGPGKYNDGDGLWLAVSQTGARKWFVRVVINGKRREMGLGAFGTRPPGVSLAEARQKAAEAQAQVGAGFDPVARKQAVATVVPSFTSAAAAYIRARRREWSNIKHARQWTATLKTYARPAIGTQPVDTITTEDILGILQPIWNTKTETAKRVQGRMENIFDFAAARKWRDPINPARWRGHLDKLLASPTKIKKQRNGGVSRHQPALTYQDVPGFVEALRTLDSISAKALEFLILTACRTTEVLDARWDEIDLNSRVWTIPAVRMKARREHRVPLSESAFTLLNAVPRIASNQFVFFGARNGRPLSNMALLQLMRGIGYGVGGSRGDAVPHGFRSSFRDWAGEVSSFPNHVCEMALAHVVANKAEAAYRRGDLFDKRRAMMEEWARWCEGIQDDPGLVARAD